MQIFSALINKAENEASAERWYEAMSEAGVAPDVTTFNTLIKKAESEASAERWRKAMRENEVTSKG